MVEFQGQIKLDIISNFYKKKLTKKNEEEIIKKFKNIIFKKILKCKFILGAYSFIKNNKNYVCYISSGTPQKELRKICKIRGISKYFKNIRISFK